MLLLFIDTEIPDKGLENYSSVKIDGFSPSMKLVLNIIKNHGPLTQKERIKVTRLPTRTVRYALRRLKQEDILEEREYFQVIIAFVFPKTELDYQILLIYLI